MPIFSLSHCSLLYHKMICFIQYKCFTPNRLTLNSRNVQEYKHCYNVWLESHDLYNYCLSSSQHHISARKKQEQAGTTQSSRWWYHYPPCSGNFPVIFNLAFKWHKMLKHVDLHNTRVILYVVTIENIGIALLYINIDVNYLKSLHIGCMTSCNFPSWTLHNTDWYNTCTEPGTRLGSAGSCSHILLNNKYRNISNHHSCLP